MSTGGGGGDRRKKSSDYKLNLIAARIRVSTGGARLYHERCFKRTFGGNEEDEQQVGIRHPRIVPAIR